MMKLLKTTLLSLLAISSIGTGMLLLATPSYAADARVTINPGDIGYSPTVKNASNSTIAGIMNTVYFIAGMVAILVIIIAGIMFMTSNGDSNQVSQARQAILAAVIGLVFIMFAFVITQFVIKRIAG